METSKAGTRARARTPAAAALYDISRPRVEVAVYYLVPCARF